MKKLRIGSRESALALAQTEIIKTELKKYLSETEIEIITMKTQGDIILDSTLDDIGGKGLFIKELDRALLEDKIDIAVHSLKDVPSVLEKNIEIAAFYKRGDARDVLVLPEGTAKEDKTKPIGCSGGRRQVQLKKIFPDWQTALVRGNVITRLKKLDAGEYGALVLAAAGLKRLGLEKRISRYFTTGEIVPAAGQGILAVCKKTDSDFPFLDRLDDKHSRYASLAERAFVRALDSGCSAPVAAYSNFENDKIILDGIYAESKDDKFVKDRIIAELTNVEQAGRRLAYRLFAEYHKNHGSQKGKVVLVGAGPGDAGLLTVKGSEALRKAEVVLYDNLAGKGIVSGISHNVKTIYVGKKSGAHTLTQEQINLLLIREALDGKNVVRLKGGDPFLFGRGGEEIEGLIEAGIDFEIVPGVSSSLAVPAYFGIPVTHRDYCSQVHIITAHAGDGKKRQIDYKALADAGGTLIFLMGVASLASICDGLIAAGLDPATPAAVLEQGSTAKQKKVVSSISNLLCGAKENGIKAPAITVVGKVCSLAKEFSWVEKKSLASLRIAVTRPAARASKLSQLLRAEGAEVVEIPSITSTPLNATPALESILNNLTVKECFTFTSPFGVDIFFEKLILYNKDIRSLCNVKFAAIGSSTASALRQKGITADFVPQIFSGAELGKLLASKLSKDSIVVLPRSKIGTDDILKPLSEACIKYIDIPVYDTETSKTEHDPYFVELLLEGIDWVTFTSASTVTGFTKIAGAEKIKQLQDKNVRALCIGGQTAATAKNAGFNVLIAESATIPDMVNALKNFRLSNHSIPDN
ncbi:hypothetical protein AGMMS50212_10820 [Spirochaetia bacterium]|nr:hypothetical protein AGMMS50212_10820 [Spirochaetia bacterium]